MSVNEAVHNDVVQFWHDYETTARTGKRAASVASARGLSSGPEPEALVSAWKMIEPHVSEDYIFVDPYGCLVDKEHLAEMIKTGAGVFQKFERTHHNVKAHGDVAVYVSLVTLSGERLGEDVSGQYREMHVLRKVEHGWLVVASQMTKLDPDHAREHRERAK